MTAILSASVIALASSVTLRSDDEPPTVERIVATPVATPTPTPTIGTAASTSAVRREPASAASSLPDGRIGELRALVMRIFGRQGPNAVRVADCETGGTWDPAVVNSSGHTGLFQISPEWHAWRAEALGYTWADMRTAEPNIRVAKHLYDEQGWGPWTCAHLRGIA